MKKLFLIATAIVFIGGATIDKAGACDLRFPIFELMGFPISPHQVALLGGANVVERSPTPTPTLMLAGMPASPSQVAILAPRPKAEKIHQASVKPGRVTVGLPPSLLRSASAAGRDMCVLE
jgi:hypothetical protein